jgi:hypothetical protein
MHAEVPEHAEQLAKAFIEDLRLPEQLSDVLSWLQRRHQLQEELTITSSNSSSDSSIAMSSIYSTSNAYATLWYACMRCLAAVTSSAVRCEWSKHAQYAEHLLLALAKAGEYFLVVRSLLESCMGVIQPL